MPVFGQSTDFNERLCSLMSSLFYNSNKIYDSSSPSVAATTMTIKKIERPLFTNAILQKAARLEELKYQHQHQHQHQHQQQSNSNKHKPHSQSSSVTQPSTPTKTTTTEVVLVVETMDRNLSSTSSTSQTNPTHSLLAKLISQFFSMPENNDNHLEVITVRSHSIREDLIASSSSSEFTSSSVSVSTYGGGDTSCRYRKSRVWVSVGSAMTGLYQYLLLLEGQRLKERLLLLAESKPPNCENGYNETSPSSAMIAGVVCINPPSYLWKSYGKSLLYQTCLTKIPSLFVVNNGEDHYDETSFIIRKICIGEILRDCVHHPHALVVVTKGSNSISSSISNSSNNKENDNNKDHLDYCVWLARLITKYTESVQRLRTPPTPQSLLPARTNTINGNVRTLLSQRQHQQHQQSTPNEKLPTSKL